MKLNFKKIVPVLTGAILLGSTIGFASSVAGASYPADFKDAVVVVGLGNDDAMASAEIAKSLGSMSASTSVSGESVPIESSSDNLNVGNELATVQVNSVDDADLSSLLADGSLRAGSETYDYTQKITLASGLKYENVRDEDELSDDPQLAVALAEGDEILNYTLKFSKDVTSDIESTNHMVDLEDETLEILGKSYTILNAYNGTSGALELMAGAENGMLEEGATKDYVVNGKTNGKTYSVEVRSISSDDDPEVKLVINGETTSALVGGDTYTLEDDTEIGIRDVTYAPKESAASSVEFTLGAEKLTLQNATEVELGEDTVDGLWCFMTKDADSIREIILQWKAEDTAYISKMAALQMPGLESLSIQAGDLTLPMKEEVSIKNNGEDKIEISFPFISNEAGESETFDLLYSNGTHFAGLGQSATHQIITGSTEVVFNESKHDYFVATYVSASGTSSESYLLEAKINEGTDGEADTVDIVDVVNKDVVCDDVEAPDNCDFGDVLFRINTVNDTTHLVNITATTANTFNRIVSKEGLMMSFPSINTSALATTATLVFYEENKDEEVEAVSTFNVTVGHNDNGDVEVSSTAPTITSYEMGESDVFVYYTESDLATKLTYDKSPDQDTLEIEYHGEEVIGNVWLTAPGVTAGSLELVEDTAVVSGSKYRSMNLIVIGGPAINSIAAELMGLSADLVKNQGDASTLAPGMAKLTLFENQPSTGNVALLVAGYAKEDTLAAERALVAGGDKAIAKGTLTASTAYSYA